MKIKRYHPGRYIIADGEAVVGEIVRSRGKPGRLIWGALIYKVDRFAWQGPSKMRFSTLKEAKAWAIQEYERDWDIGGAK